MSRWIWSVALVAWACDGVPEEPELNAAVCVPNHQIECTCPGGAIGVMECLANGSDYGQCVCGSSPTSCENATTCFDECLCQGNDGSQCLDQCVGGGNGMGGVGGSSGSSSGGGSSGLGGGGSGAGGVGPIGCEGCISQACAGELSGCASTPGCIDLVHCAEQSGCWLDDYTCLLISCGSYLSSFAAVGSALSLGSCASSACANECS